MPAGRAGTSQRQPQPKEPFQPAKPACSRQTAPPGLDAPHGPAGGAECACFRGGSGAQGLSPSELTRRLPMLEARVHTCVRSRVWDGGSCVHVCVCVRFLGPMHPSSSHFLAGGLREEPQVRGWGASHRQSSAGRPLTHSHPHPRSRPFSGEQSSILRFRSGFWRQFWGPRPGPERLALWDGQPKVLRRSPIPSSHCTEEETEVPRPQGRAPGDRASPELRWSGR